MMKILIAAAALAGLSSTATAQQPTAVVSPNEAEIDPSQLELARKTAAALLPPGSYEKMMRSSMEQMVGTITSQMYNSRMADILPEGSAPDLEIEREIGDKTIKEVLGAGDPHFEERMRITNRILFQEVAPIMGRIEPDVREGLARAYARKFSAAQLQDINRFFETGSGRLFAAESMTTWVDPEIMSLMAKLTPELMKEMPAIMEKTKAATAHLPPPPAPPKSEDEES